MRPSRVLSDTEDETPAVRPPRFAEAPAADPVRTYLSMLGRTKLLTAQAEVTLAVNIEAGLFAAERLRRSDTGEEQIAPELQRDLRQIVRTGAAARACPKVSCIRPSESFGGW